jgi:hypothetical protein
MEHCPQVRWYVVCCKGMPSAGSEPQSSLLLYSKLLWNNIRESYFLRDNEHAELRII